MIDRSFFADAVGAEYELRALTPGGLWVAQRVRDHLTIGSSIACDLIIDDEEAGCIHAIVFPTEENGWELRGVGSSTMLMPDGRISSVVRLVNGVNFMIAHTPIVCEEIPFAGVYSPEQQRLMVIEKEILAAGVAPDDEASGSVEQEQDAQAEAARLARESAEREARLVLVEHAAISMGRCPTCWKSLSGLAPIARYCPKCGAKLPEMSIVPPAIDASLQPMYEELRAELDAKLAQAPSSEASRLMVLAYASALLNLGWRYEHGASGSRNLPEAARCYAKAGRLARTGEGV
jgi:hypothetical protein